MAPLLSAFVERRRLEAARPYVRGDVLDLGCGRGAALELLGPGQAYLGVDVHPSVFHPRSGSTDRIGFLARDFDRDPLAINQTFDTVLMLAVIEHLPEPLKLLAQVGPLMRREARLVITTPSPVGLVAHQVGARMGLFCMSAAEEHQAPHSPSELRSDLRACGFVIERHAGFLMGANQLVICSAGAPRGPV